MALLTVHLGKRSYDIVIESGALRQIGGWAAKHATGDRLLVVADENSAALFADAVLTSLNDAGVHADLVVVPPGEESKSLAGAEKIYTAAIQAGLDRDGTLLALGGGVIGDLAGFAAATYLRGVSFLQVPTTLLAQVDSSVGGKVAVNHPLGKNLIGVFYQPRGVLIDPLVLDSLPEREFCSGMAEVLKYGLIADEAFFRRLTDDSAKILQRDPALLTAMIADCCRMKAAVVEQDELDKGKRAWLNFGHTVGHAVEAAGNFQRFTHGEAVALGMLAATKLSELEAGLRTGVSEQLQDVLKSYRLPTNFAGAGEQDLLVPMAKDKKRLAGSIHWVLLRRIGQAESIRNIPAESVQKALQVILRVG